MSLQQFTLHNFQCNRCGVKESLIGRNISESTRQPDFFCNGCGARGSLIACNLSSLAQRLTQPDPSANSNSVPVKTRFCNKCGADTFCFCGVDNNTGNVRPEEQKDSLVEVLMKDVKFFKGLHAGADEEAIKQKWKQSLMQFLGLKEKETQTSHSSPRAETQAF